jgi:hypothetical protein
MSGFNEDVADTIGRMAEMAYGDLTISFENMNLFVELASGILGSFNFILYDMRLIAAPGPLSLEQLMTGKDVPRIPPNVTLVIPQNDLNKYKMLFGSMMGQLTVIQKMENSLPVWALDEDVENMRGDIDLLIFTLASATMNYTFWETSEYVTPEFRTEITGARDLAKQLSEKLNKVRDTLFPPVEEKLTEEK